jgi:hypothetical protein
VVDIYSQKYCHCMVLATDYCEKNCCDRIGLSPR